MKHFFILLVLFSSIVTTALADEATVRLRVQNGARPITDLFYQSKDIEVYIFDTNGPAEDVEFGISRVVSENKYHAIIVGMYAANFTEDNLWFGEPYFILKLHSGKVSAVAKTFIYFPLNGGKTFIGAEWIGVAYQVKPSLKVGPGFGFFKSNPGKFDPTWGIQGEWSFKRNALAIRFSDDRSIRFDITRNF